MKKELIGYCGVDSGQLIICDPCYIKMYKDDDEGEFCDNAHTVYKNINDNTLWQFTYGKKSSVKDCNPFPGSYETIIPQYGKSPNQLKSKGTFIELDIDPVPHTPDGMFSYGGICKLTSSNKSSGQLKFPLGHDGIAVAFSSGYGDGYYPVYGYKDNEGRIVKVEIIMK